MNEIIQRAQTLAAQRGVKTKAGTLGGLMRALHGTRTTARTTARTTKKTSHISMVTLVEGYDQGRARVRTIDPYTPLLVTVAAALGRDTIDSIGCVPNSYRGQAEASAASAVRCGDSVLLRYGRFGMRHSSGGRGAHDLIPSVDSGTRHIRRREVMAAIRLPAGWRWGADKYGAYVTGPGVSDYHPEGAALAAAIGSRDWSGIIHSAQTAAEKRRSVEVEQRQRRRQERRDRLLARLSGTVLVSRADARLAGYCNLGINAWCRQAGIDDDVTSLPARDVVRLAQATGEPRAVVAAIVAVRRALAASGASA